MKVILNILTHGDETVGFVVAKELKKLKIIKGEFIIHVANELAYRKKKRFIDEDLNRAFPGDKSGNHEQKLAAKIFPLVKSVDIVIDIHATKSNLRDAVIVTKLNKKTKEYVEAINPKYLLWMRATKNNALISNAKVGIAFEYGKNNDKTTAKNTIRDIKKLLSHIGMISKKIKTNAIKTTWLDVYKSVPKEKGAELLPNIKNYKLVKKDRPYATLKNKMFCAEKDFYPILFGSSNYKDIFGFAARPIPQFVAKKAKSS